jgi:hypothetical protein
MSATIDRCARQVVFPQLKRHLNVCQMVHVLKYSNGKIFQQENHVDNASDIYVWWPVRHTWTKLISHIIAQNFSISSLTRPKIHFLHPLKETSAGTIFESEILHRILHVRIEFTKGWIHVFYVVWAVKKLTLKWS